MAFRPQVADSCQTPSTTVRVRMNSSGAPWRKTTRLAGWPGSTSGGERPSRSAGLRVTVPRIVGDWPRDGSHQVADAGSQEPVRACKVGIVIRAPLRGPSPGRTAAMSPFRISISIQLDVLKSRATITMACSPGLGGPTARTRAARWPRPSPAELTHGSSPSAAARRPRNRGRADGPWSAWIEIRDGTERPGTRGGCAARRSRQ